MRTASAKAQETEGDAMKPNEPITPRPELLLNPTTPIQQWEFGVISAATWPFFAPYRIIHSQPQPLLPPTGRTPRLLSAIIATLIHYNDPCYDPATRTMRLADGWTNITRTLGIWASRPSRQIITDCLTKMRAFPVAAPTRCVALEHTDLDPTKPAAQRNVTLTKEYAHACRQDLREVSFVTMRDLTGALELDLYALASLYAPDDGRLRATRRLLSKMMPGSRRRLGSGVQRDRLFASLNAAQDRWTYGMDDEHDMLVIAGRDADGDGGTVTLS